jgi:ATP-binding cassette subfamily F protein 3
VGVLSGGEKSRVALAKMLLNPGNFLIFDEPTNRLDMQSKQILQQALMQFEGTLMIVSHDRDFLDPIVNKTLEIRPGEIKTWLGDLSYYLEKTEVREQEEKAEKNGGNSDASRKLSRKEERRIEAERRNALSKKLKPLKNRLEEIESDIAAREERKEEIEAMMADSHFYDDSDKVKEISLEYEELKTEIAEKMHKWEEIAGRIEFVESEYERGQAADG